MSGLVNVEGRIEQLTQPAQLDVDVWFELRNADALAVTTNKTFSAAFKNRLRALVGFLLAAGGEAAAGGGR
mgnify:CR=1 FL=1